MRGGKIVEYKKKILGLLLFFTVSFIFLFYKSNTVFISNLMFLILNISTVLVLYSDSDFSLNSNSLVILFFIFALLSLVSVIWAEDVIKSGLRSLTLIQLSINNFIVYSILKKYKLGNYILWGIILVAFINHLIGLNLIHLGIKVYSGVRFVGTLGNSNGMAMLMIFSILASFIFLTRKLHIINVVFQYINILLSLYIVMLTASRKGVIFSLMFIFLYIISSLINLRRLLSLVLIFVVCSILSVKYLDMDKIRESYSVVEHRFYKLSTGLDNISSEGEINSSAKIRKYYIEEGISMFKERPLLGWGMNAFSIFYGTYSHCNYTEVLLGSGIIGFLLYYSMYIFLIIKILKMRKDILFFYLIFIVLFLLLRGIALVDYYSKLNLIMLVYLSCLAEINQKDSNISLIEEIGR